MKIFTLAFILVMTLSSCWNKTDDEYNDVYIRLENKTGRDITKLTIGKRIYKPGGLNFVDFNHRFDELRNNAFTDFFDTQGRFLGYSNFRGHIDDRPMTWSSEEKDEELLASGAYQDSWENPFSDNFWEGYSLEKGRYTYVISLSESGRFFLIDIVEEE